MSAEQASSAPQREEAQDSAVWKSGPIVGLIFLLATGSCFWLLLQTLFFEAQTLRLPSNPALSSIVEQSIYPTFNFDEFRDGFGALPPDLDWKLNRNNAMLLFGVLGGLAGAGLALGEAFSRRSLNTAVVGGLACIVVGAGIGSLGGYLGIRSYNSLMTDHQMSDLIRAMRVYALTLGIMGGGVGLGAGLFLGCRLVTAAKCLVAGLLAGVLAAVVYPLGVAFLFKTATTKVFLPVDGPERILWVGLITGLLGLIVTAVAAEPVPKGSATS